MCRGRNSPPRSSRARIWEWRRRSSTGCWPPTMARRTADMPEGVRLFQRFDGPANAPVLLLSNSLGTALEMWDPQMPAFVERFRVLRYDMRGHGRSAGPPGPYSIADLGRDDLALLAANGIARVHFCGFR